MVCNTILAADGLTVYAEEETVNIYFMDATREKWIQNDSATIVLIDNSHNHKTYDMKLTGEYTWSAKVPKSAKNITFNRYDQSKTNQWNSWSAGGREDNNTYYVEGSEYGHWGVKEETGFQAGDVVYLDVGEFKDWVDKAETTLYINFSAATKDDNSGEDIIIASADSTLFSPCSELVKVEEYVYKYTVTNENAGKQNLRFWRGNDTMLWNCSCLMKYEDYTNGNNCIKVTGWNNNGEVSKYIKVSPPDIDIGEIYFQKLNSDNIEVNKDNGLVYEKNQILVSALPGLEKTVMEDILSEIDGQIVGYIALTNDYQIQFNESKSYDELMNLISYFESFSFIESASLNIVLENESDAKTNDKLYEGDSWDEENPDGNNWGLEALKIPSAWELSNEDNEISVGVIDSEFDMDHPDLVFEKAFNNPVQINDIHGTQVAGIIAATRNNNYGIAGVVDKVKLYGYTVGYENGKMFDYITVMEYKYALALLIGNNVKIINISQNNGRLQAFAASHGNENAKNYVRTNADILGEFLHKLELAGYDFLIVAAAGNANDLFYCADKNDLYGYHDYDKIRDNLQDVIQGGVLAYNNNFLNAIELESVKSRIITVGSIGYTYFPQKKYVYSKFSNIGERVDVCAPGEKILSTIPSGKKSFIGVEGFDNNNGTSFAAPYISGIAGLLYQKNPTLNAYAIKKIICNNFSTKVSGNNGETYKLPDAYKCMKAAANYSSDDNIGSVPTGVLIGTIKNIGNNPVKNAKLTAYRVSTGESNLENYFTCAKTDESGNYDFVLEQGTYNLNISAEGYLPCTIKNIVIAPDETKYLENIIAVKWGYEDFFSKVSGGVKNALTGENIPDVEVRYRPGWNNQSGNYVHSFLGITVKEKTDYRGEFTSELPVGIYTAELIKEGFVTGYVNVVSTTGDSGEIQIMVLTPELSSDEYRIVLTWGKEPKDLDAHLVYKKQNNILFHIFYRIKMYSPLGENIAGLDLDDTTSYGPETITIKKSSELLSEGKFTYIVHDYTNRNNRSSNKLSLSNSFVRVYKGNTLIESYSVPQNITGNTWRVFELSKDGLCAINQFDIVSDETKIQ